MSVVKKKIVSQIIFVIIKIIFYLCSSETKQLGLCIVIDAQRSTWKTTKNIIHKVFEILDENIGAMLVVRLDVFWDKQRVENCTKSRTEGEVRIEDNYIDYISINASKSVFIFENLQFKLN